MSETEIREGAWFEKLWLWLKPPLHASVVLPVGLRELPRFLTVSDFAIGDSFTIVIPTARRTWWIVAIFGLLALWSLALPLLVALSSSDGGWNSRGGYNEPNFSVILFILGLGLLIGVSWSVWRWAFPRICITADHEAIRVHGRKYDWSSAKGFRLGYSLGGVEREDKQGPYAGLRMAYGPWGDDLPFMIRHYYAPAYIVFLNDALRVVEPRATAAAESKINTVMF